MKRMINSLDNKWFAIVNPNAGNGKGKHDWERISSILERNNIEVFAKFTTANGDAAFMTSEAIFQGYRKILSVGGDGTLNEVVNGIMLQESCPTDEVTIGVIPVGTGNDWGRMFNIPLVYEGAVQILKNNKSLAHDVAVLTYFENDKQLKRYFINIAGTGFEAAVIQKTNKKKNRETKNSSMMYLFNVLSSMITYKSKEMTITIDDFKFHKKIFSMNLGNGRYCGGGMRQTPDAVPNDGLLDVTIINGNIGKFEMIKAINSLYDGTILSHPKIDGFRAKRVTVECDEPVYAEADGESLGHTPLEFSIIPSAVKILIR